MTDHPNYNINALEDKRFVHYNIIYTKYHKQNQDTRPYKTKK